MFNIRLAFVNKRDGISKCTVSPLPEAEETAEGDAGQAVVVPGAGVVIDEGADEASVDVRVVAGIEDAIAGPSDCCDPVGSATVAVQLCAVEPLVSRLSAGKARRNWSG